MNIYCKDVWLSTKSVNVPLSPFAISATVFVEKQDILSDLLVKQRWPGQYLDRDGLESQVL
uniref:Bestrophin homolog n=1 Tax=Loa loa TaxID=7209 RepID=A0A1I7V860_LOALO